MPDTPPRAGRVDPIDARTRRPIADAQEAPDGSAAEVIALARRAVAARRQRNRHFDPVLFSNPAWDMLLNLFVAEADGRPMTVLDGCTVSAMPQSVTLRWLGYLKQEKMVVEFNEPRQSRQTLLRLSPQTRDTIAAYFSVLAGLEPGPEPWTPETPPSEG